MTSRNPTPRQKVLAALEVVRLAGGSYEDLTCEGDSLHLDLRAPEGFVWVANGLSDMYIEGNGGYSRRHDWQFAWRLVKQGIRGRDHNV